MSFQGEQKIKLAHIFEMSAYNDNPNYKHSSAKVTTFERIIEAQQSEEEWISRYVLCPECHEQVELRCFQQEMVHLSEVELRGDQAAREKVRKYLTKGARYRAIVATVCLTVLGFVYYGFIQSEFINNDISIFEVFDPQASHWEYKDISYLIYYLMWILGPLIIVLSLAAAIVFMDTDGYLNRSQVKSLVAGELSVILTPKMARKAGLTATQCADTRMRLRTVLCEGKDHSVVNKGNYQTSSTGWNDDRVKTVTGDDIWKNEINIWREDNDGCAEFGVRYWR